MDTCIEKLVHQLEDDPEAALCRPEVRTPEVFDVWIRRCLELTASNPREGLPHVDTALLIAATSCQVVQCFGVTAAAHRNLGELEAARALLEEAFRISKGCAACEADLFRRRGVVHAAARRPSNALADADRAVASYHTLSGQPDHDLQGSGLAKAYLSRGDIRFYVGRSGFVEDISTAVKLIEPSSAPSLYGTALLNLGVALRASGGVANLLVANEHIRTARGYFQGRKHKASRELAHLDWQTAMIRFELRRHPEGLEVVSERPATLRKMLHRSLEDFVEVGAPAESSAVASDLALLAFPNRTDVRELMEETLDRIRARWHCFAPEVREAYKPIGLAMLEVRTAAERKVRSTAVAGSGTAAEVKEGLRSAIKNLRVQCDDVGGMLPCLLTWPA